jgi:lipid II:glycine glycyltransferase (peptidoglycan interpeptide bridge formation enzyme)
MITREVQDTEKSEYNKVVGHPLQSWEWGEFREKSGQQVIRIGVFDNKKIISGYQILFSNVPKSNFTIGTFLRGQKPDLAMVESLQKIGRQYNAIFIKIEPLVAQKVDQNTGVAIDDKPLKETGNFLLKNGCLKGKPLFPKHTFWLDLTKSEDQLLSGMHPKTRYNLNLSMKHGVAVNRDDTLTGLETFIKLHFETASREGFFSHNQDYHRLMWEILSPAKISHLLIAKYQNIPLVAWVLFTFNKNLYYPYGGSNRIHREVMASYAMMWEAIKYGKTNGCKIFDMWGTPGPNPNPKDPWFGFHRFKSGFGPDLMEFAGSFDLILNSPMYRLYNLAEKTRWMVLKPKAKISSLLKNVKH